MDPLQQPEFQDFLTIHHPDDKTGQYLVEKTEDYEVRVVKFMRGYALTDV